MTNPLFSEVCTITPYTQGMLFKFYKEQSELTAALVLGHWFKRLPDGPGVNLLVAGSGKGVGGCSGEGLGYTWGSGRGPLRTQGSRYLSTQLEVFQ